MITSTLAFAHRQWAFQLLTTMATPANQNVNGKYSKIMGSFEHDLYSGWFRCSRAVVHQWKLKLSHCFVNIIKVIWTLFCKHNCSHASSSMLFLLITHLQTMKSFTYTFRNYPLSLHYKKNLSIQSILYRCCHKGFLYNSLNYQTLVWFPTSYI